MSAQTSILHWPFTFFAELQKLQNLTVLQILIYVLFCLYIFKIVTQNYQHLVTYFFNVDTTVSTTVSMVTNMRRKCIYLLMHVYSCISMHDYSFILTHVS